MTPVLKIQDLHISVGDKTILGGADLYLDAGKLSAVMGPMGGGKSTLFRFLAGGLPDDTFEVGYKKAEFHGGLLEGSNRPIVIFQDVRAQGGSADIFAARVEKIQAARAQNSGLICVDEPTAGLSTPHATEMMDLLREIAHESAVLLVSHNTDEIRRYADFIALIAGGHFVSALPNEQFFDGVSDAHSTHFLKTGGLDIPHKNTPIHFLAPESRVAPGGFDKTIANPAKGIENWLIKDKLSVINLPVERSGTLKPESFALAKSRRIYHFDRLELKIFDDTGVLENRFTWQDVDHQPDRNPPLTASICREISESLIAGKKITINSGFNQTAAAAVLGAFLIMKNFSPADALDITAKKFPELHFGMRIEQFLWDMDIEMSMS